VPKAPIEEVALETFQHVLNVNIAGPFLCAKEAFKIFKRQEPQGGTLTNVKKDQS
jgi:NAD(P)-dependent dehydrogenase (short-subunit alcohol dehydrogenase family)